MLSWLKTYWPVAILVLLMLAVIDGTFSSLFTCHPTVSGADQQQAKEYCTALNGPVLVTLKWLAKITHKYEGLITATFTIVLAVFTARLWFSTEKLSIATKRLVEGAEDTAQRQLRAYVYVDKASVTLEGRKLNAVIELKNSGQTPAYNLVATSRLETEEAGKEYVPRPLESTISDRGIVGPGGVAMPTPTLEVPADNSVAIPAFKEGRGILYLIGQARYEDAFNRVWILDFSLRSHSFEAANNRWILSPTEDGNKETQEK